MAGVRPLRRSSSAAVTIALAALAILGVHVLPHVSLAGGGELLWHATISGDTVSVNLNRFAERRLRFPVDSVPVAQWIRRGLSGYLTYALIPVSATGQPQSGLLRFHRANRLCRNVPLFWMKDADPTSSEARGFPNAMLECRGDSALLWYASPDTAQILLTTEHRSWIYDRSRHVMLRSDTVAVWGVCSAGDRFSAVQFAGWGERGSRARVALMKWSGDLEWASPWLIQEPGAVYLFPDGSTVYYALDKAFFCRSPQDAIAHEVAGVSFGNARFAANGSRMLVNVWDARHDTAVAYDLETPTAPVELFRQSWADYLVTDGAVSASGTHFAVMLQQVSSADAVRCLLVVLDGTGQEIFQEPLAESNPPLGFIGEFLFVGSALNRDEFQRDGEEIQVYSCE